MRPRTPARGCGDSRFCLGLSLGPVVEETAAAHDEEALRDAVARGLRRLTDPQRSVLVAKLYDGLTFAEIAAEHEVAVPTVKTHYVRALASMRETLAPQWAPEGSKERSTP